MFKDVVNYVFVAPFKNIIKNIKDYNILKSKLNDAKMDMLVARGKITKVYHGDETGLACVKIYETVLEDDGCYSLSSSYTKRCIHISDNSCNKKDCPFYKNLQKYYALKGAFKKVLADKRKFWSRKLVKVK